MLTSAPSLMLCIMPRSQRELNCCMHALQHGPQLPYPSQVTQASPTVKRTRCRSPCRKELYTIKHGDQYADLPALSHAVYDAARSERAELLHTHLAARFSTTPSISSHAGIARAQTNSVLVPLQQRNYCTFKPKLDPKNGAVNFVTRDRSQNLVLAWIEIASA